MLVIALAHLHLLFIVQLSRHKFQVLYLLKFLSKQPYATV